ncbi:MAG: hypothetical protein L6R40_001602 [Gallowayella cf. fulva]|nr:MAG: hypothetical protein L6R40_001602 [Xanthomendoza cf. fulva]
MESMLESMSDNQCHEQDERKSPIGQAEKVKPHIRACQSCRSRKIRCIPQDSSKDGKCQRCAKSKRECVFTSPEKRRRRKRTDARVADLENMVHMLAARLEQEQRARLDQDRIRQKPLQSHDLDPVLRSSSQPPNMSSQSPRQANEIQLKPFANSGNPLKSDSCPPRHYARDFMTKEPLSGNFSSNEPATNTQRRTHPTQLPRMATLSPNLIVQEPLPSPLPQNRIPDILSQQSALWPTSNISLNTEQHQQATANDDVYSPCPSHSSTFSHSDTCSSEASPYTNFDLPASDKHAMFDGPTTSPDFNSMDAAISAQLNIPCQDQSIWWPQSNTVCLDFPADGTAPIRNWFPREDVSSWQATQWA